MDPSTRATHRSAQQRFLDEGQPLYLETRFGGYNFEEAWLVRLRAPSRAHGIAWHALRRPKWIAPRRPGLAL